MSTHITAAHQSRLMTGLVVERFNEGWRGQSLRLLIVEARAAQVDSFAEAAAFHAGSEWGARYREWAQTARQRLAASERRAGVKAPPVFDPDIAREMRAECVA